MRGMILKPEDLKEVRKWVNINNDKNPDVKVSAIISNGVLLSFEFRFLFKVKQDIEKRMVEDIFNAVETVSHQRLFPYRYLDLRTGIIEVKVSYTNQETGVKDIFKGLEFIRNDISRLIRE